jgi:TRAP transporter TAXI family solute receptor
MRIRFLATALMIAAIWPTPSWSTPPGWPTSLTIGTASPGGMFLPYGQALAPILTEALGLPVTAQATQGPDQNILLIESGNVQLGFVTTGAALQAWNGAATWASGKQLRTMRALFAMYDTPFEAVVLKSSGIRTFADMAGKRVSAGPHGGSGGTYMVDFFKALEVPVTVRYGAWTAMASEMTSGLLDVLVGAAGIRHPTLAKLDTTEAVEFIRLNAGEIAKLRTAMPEFSPSVVPAGTYPLLKSDYATVGLYNFAVVSKDLPDDLVYAILKAFYANHDRLVEAQASARESVIENLQRNEFLPYHPGALRYYREIGVEIPASLVSRN